MEFQVRNSILVYFKTYIFSQEEIDTTLKNSNPALKNNISLNYKLSDFILDVDVDFIAKISSFCAGPLSTMWLFVETREAQLQVNPLMPGGQKKSHKLK